MACPGSAQSPPCPNARHASGGALPLTLVTSLPTPLCAPGLSEYLTERGTLLYNGRTPEQSFLSRFPFKGGAILELDWQGRVLWEVCNPDHHHDGILQRQRAPALPRRGPEEIGSRVAGGTPDQSLPSALYANTTEGDARTMYADYLAEITRTGQTVWQWRSWEHLDPVEDGFSAGLGLTVHVGEFASTSVAAALRTPGLRRIGHGTHSADDPRLMDAVARSGVTLECPLTRNVMLGSASTYEDHPIRRFVQHGIRVTLATDLPMHVGTSIGREYAVPSSLGFSPDDLLSVHAQRPGRLIHYIQPTGCAVAQALVKTRYAQRPCTD